MFEKLNNANYTNTIKEGIDLQELSFAKLAEFAGETLYVDGFFFTVGDYGKQVVVVASTMVGGRPYKVNMPQRAVEQFEQIAADKEMLDAVLDGHMKIVNIAKLKNTTGYTLADC